MLGLNAPLNAQMVADHFKGSLSKAQVGGRERRIAASWPSTPAPEAALASHRHASLLNPPARSHHHPTAPPLPHRRTG